MLEGAQSSGATATFDTFDEKKSNGEEMIETAPATSLAK